ncbi:phosphoribosylglycinamide formyltransferase-1 [Bacillus mesophilus]|uniref:Phosphoribosylglycinamide formyltransferase n=1 Tax=Bacillus mesophilus TaxID=1808955 RepID=A0A6M0QA03_9BACI|nr:phosphoribosylglycinamide formyltransferase [Bacillus mesophilus]MBM7662768.1 phosphoribosylglycinamide formyltransferase-1 [Bacillus mesophilus]NEY73172.1 phosphoribosylglycinamide formyltransferase [Bacillus mesophilus]
MSRLAIFASGYGSNFQAIVNAVKNNALPAEVVLLVCDKEGAKVIEKANKENISTFVTSPKSFESKKHYEEAILEALQEQQVDWLILAGYMRLVGETLLRAYEGKIVNIHPSLLPSFPGKDAIGQAFEAKVKITGVTVHFVDEGMDTGPIIDQEAIRIEHHDTYESLQVKIQSIEHSLYPNTIKKLVAGGNHS